MMIMPWLCHIPIYHATENSIEHNFILQILWMSSFNLIQPIPIFRNEPAGPPLGRLWQYLPHPILETLQRSEMEAAMQRRKCDSPAAGSCQYSEPETGTKCRQASYIRLNGRQKFYKKRLKKKLLPLERASPSPTQLNSDALFWSKVTTCLSPKRWFNLSKLFRSGITEAAKGTSNKSRNSWDLGPMPQPQTNCNRTVCTSWRKNWMLSIWARNCDQHRIETESIYHGIHISFIFHMDPYFPSSISS